MNTYFTVGEVAKLNNISKQTLIYYDNEDVFKPKIVDSENNYRLYTADQLEVLDSILILKEMGLSLKEIKKFMENRDSYSTVEIMKSQQSKINDKIEHLKIISKRLERKIYTIENFNKNEKNVEFLKNLKTQYIAVEPVAAPKTILQLDISLKKLLDRADRENYSYYYQIGAMIQSENLFKKNYLSADYAFIPLENINNIKKCEENNENSTESKFLNCTEIIENFQCEKDNEYKEKVYKKPKGMYAVAYHTGEYGKIGETYEKLLWEIKNNGYHAIGYSYEFCILDSLTSRKSEDYVTEIQIFVK